MVDDAFLLGLLAVVLLPLLAAFGDSFLVSLPGRFLLPLTLGCRYESRVGLIAVKNGFYQKTGRVFRRLGLGHFPIELLNLAFDESGGMLLHEVCRRRFGNATLDQFGGTDSRINSADRLYELYALLKQ